MLTAGATKQPAGGVSINVTMVCCGRTSCGIGLQPVEPGC